MSGTRATDVTDRNSIKLELTVSDLTYPGGRISLIFLRVIKSRRMQWAGSEYAWKEEMHTKFYLVRT
jgi:hypothetical protein